MKKSDFNYTLPTNLIAQQPLAQRNASRLLCVKRYSTQFEDRYFTDFIDLLQPNDLLVFNDTKVMPARLLGHKSSGGKVEILIERLLDDNHALAHIKASKALKAGAFIDLGQGYSCEVQGRVDDLYALSFAACALTISELLQRIGHIPLPPYIQRSDNDDDAQRYQTVFAKQLGAVAAPTAGLHFDEALLANIAAKQIASTFVTLHVGSGTFQPVRSENLTEHLMHREYFAVCEQTVAAVAKTRRLGGRVIAIGTTAVRALESAAITGQLTACRGDTQLFITPRYQFQVVDALLTNFHLPESTLLMLVAAFTGYKQTMAAYQHAITAQYRFFSYGDAMFLSA